MIPGVNRTVGLLCLIIFVNTLSIGAFPVLLPEIGRSNGIEYLALGTIAGAFGLARVFADIPAGLFITHFLRCALVIGVVSAAAGVVCLGIGGPYAVLVAGRALGGVGHALTMLGGLTAIIRYAPAASRSFSLNAFEMSAMLGVLCGMVAAGFLPVRWPWNLTFLVTCVPQALGLALLPSVLRSIPAHAASSVKRALFSRGEATDRSNGTRARVSRTTIVAFAVGCVIAVAWSSMGQFILPIRGSRDFGLGRESLALLLSIPQIVDVSLLLPVGLFADRSSHARVLAIVLVVMAAGVTAIGLGSMDVVMVGCALLGIGLAGWMLPVALINQDASPGGASWRTALYRTGVDAGVFVGPVLSGLLIQLDVLWMLTWTTALALLVLGAMLYRLPPHPGHTPP
jgi:MFS family permease